VFNHSVINHHLVTVFIRRSKPEDGTETLPETNSIIFQYTFWKKSKICENNSHYVVIIYTVIKPG